MTVAMLLSCDSFEMFFGNVLGLDRDRYLASYRNDWSWYYAKGLRDNGIRPIIYVPSLNESGLHDTDAGIEVRFLPLARWYKPLAWTRKAARVSWYSVYAQERLNAVALMPALRRSLAEDHAKLLYVQEHWHARFDHVVGRVPVPVSSVDQGAQAWEVVKWFKRAAFKKASTCYGQTEGECELIRKYGGRARLQPNGCDTTVFKPDPTVPRSKTILTVARLTDGQKRTSDIIRALTMLAPDWSLDVVGTGPDQAMLEALAKELNVADRVRFRGFQGRAEVLEFVRRCGVYAMPSSNEAVCLALLEAMGCGAAVVATKIRAFTPLIEDGVNGKLVPVGDPAALARAIEEAWQIRATLGHAAADTVFERFNAPKLYQQLAASMRASAGGQADAADGGTLSVSFGPAVTRGRASAEVCE